MKHFFCFILFLFFVAGIRAADVKGTITNTKGEVLPFASITVAGTGKGAVANSEGRYILTLAPGSYTLVCEYVGYSAQSKKLTVGAETITANFSLQQQELKMAEIVIRNGVDPAAEIMRQAIKRRPFYNNQVDSFTVDVYIKGLIRSRSIPNKLLGQKIEKDDMKKDGIDSAGKGILFLSESLTKVAFARPDKIKYEVISSRESGGSGFGISLPFFINFYTNNVEVFNNSLNKRGFISPLADGAFNYYNFHYEGEYTEGGKLIDRIRVTPKRKNEPLFAGFIQIVDEEWRIHSLELTTTNRQGLELIDTLRITQIHKPVTAAIWRTQNQVVYIALKKFGFDVAGNFLNVYSDYNINPGFRKKFFNRIVMAYDTGYHKKDSAYWSTMRPVPLERDERQNFIFRDSVARADRDSMYSPRVRDSLRKAQKPVQLKQLFVSGFSRYSYNKNSYRTYRFEPLIRNLEYNTVEGLAINVNQSLTGAARHGKYKYSLLLTTRYGTSNTHLNAYADLYLKSRITDYRDPYLLISGGKRVWQINRDNPVDLLANTVYTLLLKKNYIKLYESWYGKLQYHNRLENGLRYTISATAEERLPLENTTDFSIGKKDRTLLPNHPYELAGIPFNKHGALVAEATVSYQPGQRYIQFPRRKIPVGSDQPTFELYYGKGINGLLGSDVDFDKWKFSVYDNMNFKIAGELRYHIAVGGFLNNKKAELPDYQHFNGNQMIYNTKYLNSFQLAPYYRYSNIERFYALAHLEHHFNGLITNKIPLFNSLKWYLVGGSNLFYVDHNNYYAEAFAGIENIFKVVRVDFVTAYQAQPGNSFGVRIGFGGLLGGMVGNGRQSR